MPAVVILLSMILMYSMARTVAFRRTVCTLGLLRREERGDSSETAPQAPRILVDMLLRRLNVAFLLGVAVYLFSARASAWYYGTALLALCWIGSLMLASAPWLRLGTAEVTTELIAELERRRDLYRTVHDTSRLRTVEVLLRRIRAGTSPAREA